MAVSYVDQANTGDDAFVSSVSVTKPAGVVANDVGVFHVQRWNSSNDFPAVTAPSGAVLRGTTVSGAGGAWIEKQTYLIYVDAQSSFLFSWTGQRWSTLAALFFTGVDQALDLATVPFDVASASGTSIPSVSVTTVADAGLSWNAHTSDVTTATPPTGYTEVHDPNVYASGYKIATGTGETASGGTLSASSAHIIASLVALAPAGGAPITGTVNQTTETDTSQTIGRNKTKILNMARR